MARKSSAPAWGAPASRLLDDGTLHLQHGPIDLLIRVWADAPREIDLAMAQATARFDDVLATLVSELPDLRQPVGPDGPALQGPVARRMGNACRPHHPVFITPMAAVAGAVADEILAALVAGRRLRRASVNNGGDIALYLAPGESFAIGIADVNDGNPLGSMLVRHLDPVRGVATSGWGGRSLSLGIADAVTVLAADGASADAAATLIANAVTVDHPAIRRLPAREVRDDTDLGDLPVTVAVGALPRDAIAAALSNGLQVAEDMQRRGLIHAACLRLRHDVRICGPALDAGAATPFLPSSARPSA